VVGDADADSSAGFYRVGNGVGIVTAQTLKVPGIVTGGNISLISHVVDVSDAAQSDVTIY
jgi:hypothetical protein